MRRLTAYLMAMTGAVLIVYGAEMLAHGFYGGIYERKSGEA